MFADYSRELQRKQDEVLRPIRAKVQDLVKQLARKEGYTLVVEKQAAVYVSDGLELTERVIQLYNQGATATATPPAAAKK